MKDFEIEQLLSLAKLIKHGISFSSPLSNEYDTLSGAGERLATKVIDIIQSRQDLNWLLPQELNNGQPLVQMSEIETAR